MSLVDERLSETALRKRLSASDWKHSVRVSKAAVELAERFGVDARKAEIAGLLHDYARGIPKGELPRSAAELGIEVDDVARQFPYLLHAEVGARLAASELGIEDEDVLEAIANHTVGRPRMSNLEKIVYLADMIEPERAFKGVEELRRVAASDLDVAFRLGYAQSFAHLVEAGKLIHPRTVEVWNWLNRKDV